MEQEVREINLIIIHCSATRIDRNGRPADTRTLLQKAALQLTVRTLLRKYPRAQVVGHRDLSPDRNLNGRIEPHEWIKQCPCFDVLRERWD